MKRIPVQIAAGVVLFFLVGMIVSLPVGCKATLDKQGVYQGQQFWFFADRTIEGAKDDISGFLKWELDNRATLKAQGLAKVTAAADDIRSNAPQWFRVAVKARDDYTNALFSAATPIQVVQASNSLQSALLTLKTARLTAVASTNNVKLP